MKLNNSTIMLNLGRLRSSLLHHYLFLSVSFILVVVLFEATQLYAKPSPLKYHHDLNYLISNLDTYHPNPWRRTVKRAFRERLTRNPEILNSWPVGPLVNISRALKSLDPYAQDMATRINLFEQPIIWNLLPVEFGLFEEGVFITAAPEQNKSLIGLQVLRINNTEVETIIKKLAGYFPKRDAVLIPDYLRITEILRYLGASNRGKWQIELLDSINESSDSVRFDIDKQNILRSELKDRSKSINLSHYQNFRLDQQQKNVILTTPNSLMWVLSGQSIRSTLRFNKQLRMIEAQLRNQAVIYFVLDLRDIQSADPKLLNRLWTIVQNIPRENPNRKVYAVVDRSTGEVVYGLLSKMASMPELTMVGEPLGVALSHFTAGKSIQLPRTGIRVTVASHYQKYLLESNKTGPFKPSVVQQWTAEDYFSGEDSIINAVLGLIEIDQFD